MKTLKAIAAVYKELFAFIANEMDIGRFLLLCLLAFVLLVFCGFFVEVASADFALTVCRQNTDGLLLEFVYHSDLPPIAWYHYTEGGRWLHTNEWGGVAEITHPDGYAEYAVLDFGDPDYRYARGDVRTPYCQPPTSGDLPTITMRDVQGNWFTWQIQDVYGNWHEVRDKGVMVVTPVEWDGAVPFTRLVLGRDNPVRDPERYRIEVIG